ncbi:MAG: hypothetical protein HYY61_02320 [Deltaproteobacteria bacterium]|nr:hypothetical protein [Deltaproteobacteria bacterium]
MRNSLKLLGLVILGGMITTSFCLQAKTVVKTKTFKTEFISFELSDQWDCQMDGTEYVCRPISDIKKTDAIIIIAAKIPGPDDNLKAYYTYLKKTKKVSDPSGQTFTSKVNLIKYKEIAQTQWVDAIHISSELKNFYTRYLTTVKNGVAILVTYSVSRSRHSLFAAELNKMVSSIKVIAKPPQLAGPAPSDDKKPASEAPEKK